jgi:hypothetical protein
MQKITFTNSRGQSIELSNHAPYIFAKLDGLGDVDADIQTQKAPFQDGSTYTDSILSERLLTFEVAIIGNDFADVQQKRQYFATVFNPKLGEGTIRYENESGVKEIKAIPDNVPVFPSGMENRIHTFQRALVNLICPNPYWLDEYETSKQMSFLMGGLSFPLFLGSHFSQRSFKRKFMNSGDVPTPVSIDFYGPAFNPVIKNNTTGEFIQVNRTLEETDKLIISTEFGNKSVEIEDEQGNRTNVFNWIDLESSFFQLIQGENEIEYNSNNDSTKSRVIISYKNRYIAT